MQPHMILTTAGSVRRLRISLPLIADLVDGRKYFLPDTLPAPAGEELRPVLRPKITRAPHRIIPADPAARDRARQAQRLAAAEYRRHVALAEAGNAGAIKALIKCHDTLGIEGVRVVRAVLIEGRTTKQLAGPKQLEQRYLSRRFATCLSELAVTFGFSH